MRFRLDKTIGDLCVATVRKAASDLRSGAPREAHRGRGSGALGGKLAQALRNAEGLVRRERWGAVIDWHSLGQKFLWLTNGTKRQKARPVTLAPPEQQVRRAVEAAAVKHFAQRERKRGKRR